MDEVGELIRKARLSKGLSQVQLAERVGYKDSYIAKIETGRNRGSYQALMKIATALNMPPWLVLAKANLIYIPVAKNLSMEDLELVSQDPEVKKYLLKFVPIITECLSELKENSRQLTPV